MRMKLLVAAFPARVSQYALIACRLVLPAALSILWTVPVHAQLVVCTKGADAVADAIARVKGRVDPCGQSAEIEQLFATIRQCKKIVYEVCSDTGIARNIFDRPVARHGETPARTITWNPELRTELEMSCSGDRSQPLLRDPTASLLHELVHAAQDCQGLNPGEHELEAVRFENIYRRAAGLCERSGYGEELLPPSMMASCSPRSCLCGTPAGDESPTDEEPTTTVARSTELDWSGEGMNGIAVQTSGDRPAR